MSNSRDYLLNFIRSENAEVRQFQTQYYQYLLDVDKTDGLSMEQHLHQFGHAFVDPTPASNEQLTTLETSFGIKLPNDLITFYQTIGMVAGTDASQAMIFHVHSCKDLLRFFNTDKAYEQLHSLGLPHGIRHSWGNSRPEVSRGEGITEAQFDHLSNTYTWFGYISDENSESGLHFSFDSEERYCLFFWHQDQTPSNLSPDLIVDGPITQLLQSCIEGFIAVRELDELEEGELPSCYFELNDLVLWLKRKYVK